MKTAEDPAIAKGLVFNVQRFSVHDGPGIRTTVFLKGCPLTCVWCANPESQDFSPQLLSRDAKCVVCGACAQTCLRGAIRISVNGEREIDWDACDQCLRCVEACVYEALHRCGEEMNPETVMEEVLRDRLFYENSGGGLTVSGGEPLLQTGFVMGLLCAAKEQGIHTAVDTTGYVKWEKIRDVLPYTDLMLWDIKHLDARAHERMTGVGNRLILENLKRAAEFVTVWLRVPLISGFNDGEENIAGVIALAKDVGAQKISLLPYHEGGRSKNDQIGRSFKYFDGQAPTEATIQRLRGLIEREAIAVGIGN